MENAAIADQENVDEGRPALVKHRMLPEVEEMLNKYDPIIYMSCHFLGNTCMRYYWIVVS